MPPTISPRRCGWPARATRRAPPSWCFPELGLSSYAIEDLLLQDALLDQVEESIAKVVAASNKLFPVLIVGAPLRVAGRLYNTAIVIHRGVILGVVPKTYLPNYREFYEKRHFVSGANVIESTIKLAGQHGAVRHRHAVPLDRHGPRHLPCRDLRGHLGAGAAVEPCRTGGRGGAGQPVGQQHHHRQGRGAPPAVRQPVGARHRGLRLFGVRPRRIDDRSRLGRPCRDLRVRRPARRIAALREGLDHRARRRRSRPHPPGAAAQQRLRRLRAAGGRQGRALPQGRLRARRAAQQRRPRARRRALPLRAVRPGQAARQLLRGLQHPGPGPGAAPAVEPHPAGDHRRVGRPRFDAGADRDLPGDGPARPAAQEHAGLHAAGLRHLGQNPQERLAADEGAGRHGGRDRHQAGGPADAGRHRPSLRQGQEGLRRHLRERAGGPAHRLSVPPGQPARRHGGRHRRSLRAGAGLVHLRRRRSHVALQSQRLGLQDADPAPDPLRRRLGRRRPGDGRRSCTTSSTPRSRRS